MNRLLTIAILFCLLVSCSDSKTNRNDTSSHTVKYAKGFSILQHSDYTEIRVFNPWNTSQVAVTYYLVRNDSIITPDDGIQVKIPIHSIATTSVTQYEFLSLLGEIPSLRGICTPEYTYNRTIDSLYKAGKIISLGDAFNINNERLMTLQPDVLVGTFYNQNQIADALSSQTGIQTIYDNEWTETTLLGRAEWIKFIAAFYDKLPKADSIFNRIDSSYQRTVSSLKAVSTPRTVMVGNDFRGTWYMPGGNSYMGNTMRDAHIQYAYANDTTTGSIPLNFEIVLQKFSNADVWLNAPCSTLHELRQMDERNALFHSFQSGNVFSYRRRSTPSGATDYWESGIAHPDIILKDIVWAVYPELMTDYEPYYFERLKP